MELSTHTAQGVNKTERYGWSTKDEPGTFKSLHKDVLQIHPAYQREVISQKVKDITANWSWIGFGAIIVGERGGEFWVIDGQHRVLASKRRSDITHLPCICFKTTDVKSEAQGFLDSNTGRKPVTAIGSQKAKVAAGDEIANFVSQEVAALNLEIKGHAQNVGQIKCVAWCTRKASEDKDIFKTVLALGAELSAKDEMPVHEKLLEGLWFLNAKCGKGLADKRLEKKIKEKGARVLISAATKAAAYYAHGGAKVWAEGMLTELNKGMRQRFEMNNSN